jgi:hypothetical protein
VLPHCRTTPLPPHLQELKEIGRAKDSAGILLTANDSNVFAWKAFLKVGPNN